MDLKESRLEFTAIFLFLLIIAMFVLLYLGIQHGDENAEKICRNNCNVYKMPFLKSEAVSNMGYACFCVDVDGKPRQVPSEKIK